MSLLHPTPGQIYDRIGILALKIEAYRDKGLDCHKLTNEREELLGYLEITCPAYPATVDTLVASLNYLNRELWECENVMRDTDHHLGWEICALKIPKLNDRRAQIIREIDVACGCSSSVEEKVYSVSS